MADPTASHSPTKEQLPPAAADRVSNDAMFRDEDYYSDFAVETSAEKHWPHLAPKVFDQQDVLLLVQESIAQNAQRHHEMLERFCAFEENIRGLVHAARSRSPIAPFTPLPDLSELIEKKREVLAQLQNSPEKVSAEDLTLVKTFQSQLLDATSTFDSDVTALVEEYSPRRLNKYDGGRAEPILDAPCSTADTNDLFSLPSNSSWPSPLRSLYSFTSSDGDSHAPRQSDKDFIRVETLVKKAQTIDLSQDEQNTTVEAVDYSEMPPLIPLSPRRPLFVKRSTLFHPPPAFQRATSITATPVQLFPADGPANWPLPPLTSPPVSTGGPIIWNMPTSARECPTMYNPNNGHWIIFPPLIAPPGAPIAEGGVPRPESPLEQPHAQPFPYNWEAPKEVPSPVVKHKDDDQDLTESTQHQSQNSLYMSIFEGRIKEQHRKLKEQERRLEEREKEMLEREAQLAEERKRFDSAALERDAAHQKRVDALQELLGLGSKQTRNEDGEGEVRLIKRSCEEEFWTLRNDVVRKTNEKLSEMEAYSRARPERERQVMLERLEDMMIAEEVSWLEQID